MKNNKLEWKASKKFGSFYAIQECTIIQLPMYSDNLMSDEDNIVEVSIDAFSENTEQEFTDEMIKLFGENIYHLSPINEFTNLKLS